MILFWLLMDSFIQQTRHLILLQPLKKFMLDLRRDGTSCHKLKHVSHLPSPSKDHYFAL